MSETHRSDFLQDWAADLAIAMIPDSGLRLQGSSSTEDRGFRLAGRLLLLLAHFGKEGTPQPILVDISQETLAEMLIARPGDAFEALYTKW